MSVVQSGFDGRHDNISQTVFCFIQNKIRIPVILTVKTISSKAFLEDNKIKKITFKGKKLKTVNKNAFSKKAKKNIKSKKTKLNGNKKAIKLFKKKLKIK